MNDVRKILPNVIVHENNQGCISRQAQKELEREMFMGRKFRKEREVAPCTLH